MDNRGLDWGRTLGLGPELDKNKKQHFQGQKSSALVRSGKEAVRWTALSSTESHRESSSRAEGSDDRERVL